MELNTDLQRLIYFFARRITRGYPHIDHRDVAQEACLRALECTTPPPKQHESQYAAWAVLNVWNQHYTHKTSRYRKAFFTKLESTDAPLAHEICGNFGFDVIEFFDELWCIYGKMNAAQKRAFLRVLKYSEFSCNDEVGVTGESRQNVSSKRLRSMQTFEKLRSELYLDD